MKPLIGYGVSKGARRDAVRAQDLRRVEGVGGRAGQQLRVRRQRGVLRGAEQARAHLQLAAGRFRGGVGVGPVGAASSETAIATAGKQRFHVLVKQV